MIFRRFWSGCRESRNTLVANAHVHTRTVGKLLARTFEHTLQHLFGTVEFLLLEMKHGLFVKLQLLLYSWINDLHRCPLLGISIYCLYFQ